MTSTEVPRDRRASLLTIGFRWVRWKMDIAVLYGSTFASLFMYRYIVHPGTAPVSKEFLTRVALFQANSGV
jgi:hypothetical protein